MTKSEELIACYRSGQMSEAQWQVHVAAGDIPMPKIDAVEAMSTTVGHTALPWHTTVSQPNVIVNEGGNLWIARALIGHGTSPRFGHNRELAEANAAYIVQSANAYPVLVEALANLIGHAEFVARNFDVHYAHIGEARAALSTARRQV